MAFAEQRHETSVPTLSVERGEHRLAVGERHEILVALNQEDWGVDLVGQEQGAISLIAIAVTPGRCAQAALAALRPPSRRVQHGAVFRPHPIIGGESAPARDQVSLGGLGHDGSKARRLCGGDESAVAAEAMAPNRKAIGIDQPAGDHGVDDGEDLGAEVLRRLSRRMVTGQAGREDGIALGGQQARVRCKDERIGRIAPGGRPIDGAGIGENDQGRRPCRLARRKIEPTHEVAPGRRAMSDGLDPDGVDLRQGGVDLRHDDGALRRCDVDDRDAVVVSAERCEHVPGGGDDVVGEDRAPVPWTLSVGALDTLRIAQPDPRARRRRVHFEAMAKAKSWGVD